MNKDKRETEYPVELESQFILRLPEEPAKSLRELLQSGENLKNRLSLKIDPDMRHGEVRFDHWLLYGRIMDLPTIVESFKTIDRKSVYKTADICQMMVCKTEMDPLTEEESPSKNKKKDPFKVDKKYLWPHGITPPTKNVRKRRFRKTLKKKNMEAPEIEKEVKRLLRADNEALSVTWEVVNEEDNAKSDSTTPVPNKNKLKKESKAKLTKNANESSKVEDIFGDALSDSDVEDENLNMGIKELASCNDDQLSETKNIYGSGNSKSFLLSHAKNEIFDIGRKQKLQACATVTRKEETFSRSDETLASHNSLNDQKEFEIQQVVSALEELKLRRQRTQNEIAGLENMTLRQRFQDILQTLNRDIMQKEKEYRNLQALN